MNSNHVSLSVSKSSCFPNLLRLRNIPTPNDTNVHLQTLSSNLPISSCEEPIFLVVSKHTSKHAQRKKQIGFEPGMIRYDMRSSIVFPFRLYANTLRGSLCRSNEVSPEQLGVSKNNGLKSSILIGFSIINHPFWGTPIFGNIQLITGPPLRPNCFVPSIFLAELQAI